MNLKSKTSVLFIITGLNSGGAERVVFDLSRKISHDSFNIFVISLSKKSRLLDMFLEHEISTYSLNMSKTPLDLIKNVLYLSKFIKQNRIKVVHCHMIHAMIISTLLKTINYNIKVVFTSHSTKFGSKFRELIVFILKPFRNVDILFTKNMSKYYYKKNSIIIPNGIDFTRYQIKGQKNKTFTLITVGRLEEVKNHMALIDVLEKLKIKLDFKLTIVGDGELKEKIEDKIKEKNLENYVSLLGYKNNVVELLNKSHLFIMPSKWEGMPIALLEAAAVGLPVLGTPVGSIPSLITEQTGFLSDIGLFAEKIFFIYQHYDDALLRASTLKKIIHENYHIDKVITAHENLYLSLAK